MRFALSVALFAATLGPPLLACGPPELEANKQIPKTFIYNKGWTIPGLTGATVVRTFHDETGSDVVVYKPVTTAEVALQGFEVSMDGKSVQFVPGYVQVVTDIFEYRVQGRTYAYDVQTVSSRRAEPPMWQQVKRKTSPDSPNRKSKQMGGILGCGWTTLRYFDADGDGLFESLEYMGFGAAQTNSTRCPTTPEWALKLLPNRVAAERCANEDGTVNMKTSEIPPALKNILDHRPTVPALATSKN